MLDIVSLRKRSRAVDCLVILALLLAPSVVYGQEFGFADNQETAAPLADLNGWVAEVTMVVLAFLISTCFFFLVIFRLLLKLSNPWWPLTAYGFCWSGVMFVTFAVALAAFWEDLSFGQGGAVPWVKQHGGRAGVIFAWFIMTCIFLSVFRSPHSGKARS